MNLPPPTPARSSLKGNGPSLGGQRNVSFTLNPTISRAPGVITSALHKSLGPPIHRRSWQETPNTIHTLRMDIDDDPNDRNYTSTDEEADEFKDEPYENESWPWSEDDDDYFTQGITDNESDGRFEEAEENYDDYFEDSYLLEVEEKLGVKRSAFSPLREIRRTPVLDKYQSLTDSIIRRNIREKMANLERKYEQDPKKSRLPFKQKHKKSKVRISSNGSPRLQITPEIQLRKEMSETSDQPRPSGAVPSPEAFREARCNLYDEFWDDACKTPTGDPPPLPDSGYLVFDPEADINKAQIAIYNLAVMLFVFLGIVAFINRLDGVQAITNTPKTLAHALSHPGQIIPGIASTVIAMPQYIACSVVTCKSTTKNHLKTISMIASEATLDLTTVKDFSDLMLAFGKPLILNIVGNELAAKAREDSEDSEMSHDKVAIQALENLAQAYQEAHFDLRAFVTGSQNLIKITGRKWIDFSGFLTDQIAADVRAEFDLPDGWKLYTATSRRKDSTKGLKARYKTTRKHMAVGYHSWYSATGAMENNINAVLEQTREFHEAGAYESAGTLKVLEPLVESIREIRRHMAFQAKFLESNDILAENTDENFTPGTLKWKVESLWTSVTMLQDSILGRAYRISRARAIHRHFG